MLEKLDVHGHATTVRVPYTAAGWELKLQGKCTVVHALTVHHLRLFNSAFLVLGTL